MSKKKNLKQKIVVAMSVVNALNVGAAVALPYAAMTPNVLTGGATVRQLTDGVSGSMYGTAEARTTSTITENPFKDKIVADYDAIIGEGIQTSNVTVQDTGVVIILHGGTAKKDTDIQPGGVLELHSGAKINEGDDAGTYNYHEFVLAGGTLRLKEDTAGQRVEIANYNVTNGTLELANGGKATGTVLGAAGGNHGEEVIKNGGLSEGAFINNGGTQTVESGGVSQQATVNGGTQHILGGGTASEIVMAGGTVSVEDDATAQIAAATGGTLELKETGLATAVFGGLETGTFNIDTLTATGDSVWLGLGGNGGAPASTAGKTLNITNLNGSAKFYINTDLANGVSDKINITNSTKNQSTILVNFDPTIAATGQVSADKRALAVTVGDGNATFVGGETTIGGYKFMPILVQEGTNWFVTGAENTGSSDQMYAALANATWQAIAWRDSNFVIGSRMAQLHHDPDSAHQNDFWVDFTRGRMRTDTFGHGVDRTYSRVSVGYDRLFGSGWTAGLAFGYESGSEGYDHGSGDSTGNVLTAYATWQGGRGNYLDLTIKGGKLDSDFAVQGDTQLVPSKADVKTYGEGISAVYGHRFENANAFYVEPHAGFYWTHLNGYDYRMSDESDVNVDACNSFVGNLGVNVGQRLGKGEVYARADFMHDFSGNIRVSMSKAGTNNTMENPLHDSWLNIAVGYRQNYERVGWYAEAGCQSIGSRESSGDWIWRAGVEFKF